MMQAVRAVPPSHAAAGELDLSRKGPAVGMLIAGLVLLLPLCWLLLVFVERLRPDAGWPGSLVVWASSTEFIVVVTVATVGAVLVHEAIHGICFWRVTRDRPRFGLSGLSAYAAAPDWYIPLGRYAVIGLAPVAVITSAMLAAMLVLPPTAIGAAGVALVLNGVGSIGDLFAVWWLLRFRSAGSLVCDRGTTIDVYQLAAAPER